MSSRIFPPPEGAAWDELRDAAPLEVWLDVARHITRQSGLPEGEASLFPSGSDVVVRVGEVVVKLSEPRWRAEIHAEADLLGRMAGRLPVDTPRVLARGEHEGWPYVLMSFVPGQALGEVWPALAHEERVSVAIELGELLGALGRVPVPDEMVPVWEAFFAELRGQVTARLSGRRVPITAAWASRIEPYLASTPLRPTPLAWMHTELLGDHVLVERTGGRVHLSALLDFADGRVGHPFYEVPAIVEFLFKGERGLLPALLGSWGVAWDADLPRELCAWGLLHRFASLSRALQAAGAPEPEDLEALAERLYGG